MQNISQEIQVFIYFLEAHSWGKSEAELTVLNDASQTSLAFWSPDLDLGFMAPIKESNDQFRNIFFNEALAVVSAIEGTAHLPNHPQHVLVQTDSMNTVKIWHSLAPHGNNIFPLCCMLWR